MLELLFFKIKVWDTRITEFMKHATEVENQLAPLRKAIGCKAKLSGFQPSAKGLLKKKLKDAEVGHAENQVHLSGVLYSSRTDSKKRIVHKEQEGI